MPLTIGNISSSPSSWYPSGRYLAISQTLPGRFSDVTILAVERSATGDLSPGRIEPFLATPAAEANARFSPDGRWLAEASNESGRNEVSVRPFAGPGGKWQVSGAGGNGVEWSTARHELVYADLAGVRMVVPYRADGDVFAPGGPEAWPGSTPSPAALGRGWALHPDGDRLVIDQPSADQPAIDSVTLVTRLSDELRAWSRPRP